MALATDSPEVHLDLNLMSLALSVLCDEVTLGPTEPEYAEALHAAGRDLGTGLVITAVGEGLYGSSVVVFTRLVAVISLLLATGLESADEVDIWARWDSGRGAAENVRAESPYAMRTGLAPVSSGDFSRSLRQRPPTRHLRPLTSAVLASNDARFWADRSTNTRRRRSPDLIYEPDRVPSQGWRCRCLHRRPQAGLDRVAPTNVALS